MLQERLESDPTKVLIINRGVLGNIVHTLPFLAMVRKIYPAA